MSANISNKGKQELVCCWPSLLDINRFASGRFMIHGQRGSLMNLYQMIMLRHLYWHIEAICGLQQSKRNEEGGDYGNGEGDYTFNDFLPELQLMQLRKWK